MGAARVHAGDVLALDEEREAVAERDMARGVLVEQRVVEDGTERPDAALPVDERELAEPERAVVDRQLRAECLTVLVRLDRHGDTVLERHSEPADDRPVAQDERLCRGYAPRTALRVGR